MQALYVLNDGRVGTTRALEMNKPFEGGEVFVANDVPAQTQAAFGIGPLRYDSGSIGVEAFLVGLLRPTWQQVAQPSEDVLE